MIESKGGSHAFDVRTSSGQQFARILGAIAALWVVLIAGIYLIPVLGGVAAPLTPGSVLEICFAAAASWCASVLFRRSSVIASVLILIMVLAELAARIIATESRGHSIVIFAVLSSIQALRGSIAARKHP